MKRFETASPGKVRKTVALFVSEIEGDYANLLCRGTMDACEEMDLNLIVCAGSVAIGTAITLLLFVGATGKSAQLPLYVWLPDAMAGPTPVSALIHAATMVTAGVYLLSRMLPLIGSSPVVLAAIAVTGGVTALYGASCALAQRDLKRVLAYSTVSQIGYMMLGVGAGAVTAATFHLLVHAFFKALLFLGAGCVITALHHEQDIYRMGGLRKTLPLTFWPFLAGAVCLAGVPITGGFFSKDAILMAAWVRGGALYGGLYLLGLLTALITSVYTFRMVYLVFGGGIDTGTYLRAMPAVPRIMEWTLIPLALLALFGGVLNLPGYLGAGWLGIFITPPAAKGVIDASFASELALQGIAGLIALTGLAVAHLRYGGSKREERLAEASAPPPPLTAFLLNGWYFDALYRFLFIRPYEALSHILWQRLDEGLIDDGLDRFAALLGSTGQGLGKWTSGRVSLYILSFAAGAALILAYLAWVMS